MLGFLSYIYIMKFWLLGLLATLSVEAEAQKYSREQLEDQYYKVILGKYGVEDQNGNVGLGKNNQW